MRTLILALSVASAAALGSGCAGTDANGRRDAGGLSRAATVSRAGAVRRLLRR